MTKSSKQKLVLNIIGIELQIAWRKSSKSKARWKLIQKSLKSNVARATSYVPSCIIQNIWFQDFVCVVMSFHWGLLEKVQGLVFYRASIYWSWLAVFCVPSYLTLHKGERYCLWCSFLLTWTSWFGCSLFQCFFLHVRQCLSKSKAKPLLRSICVLHLLFLNSSMWFALWVCRCLFSCLLPVWLSHPMSDSVSD